VHDGEANIEETLTWKQMRVARTLPSKRAVVEDGCNKLDEINLSILVLIHQQECSAVELGPVETKVVEEFQHRDLPTEVHIDLRVHPEKSFEILLL
jgi:hypothetical protein